MSSRFLPYLPRNSSRFYSINAIPHSRQFVSSSKDTIDKASPSTTRVEPPLIIFDAPSQPSERTRRSARSPFSLSDYHGSRHRIGASAAGQVRASSSSNAPGVTPNSFGQPSAPKAEIFDRPSRPRAYYSRPQRKQDLPEIKSRFGIIAALTVAGLSAWGAFLIYATNMERVSSSVVRQLATNMKNSEVIKEALGDNVHPEGKWWLAGEPYIDGAINLLQGNVDVSFRITGSKGGGTVYFTSVREEKGRPFTILRHKIICDNGEVLQLKDVK